MTSPDHPSPVERTAGHTPGPWHVDGAKPYQIMRIADKEHLVRIASCNIKFPRYEANARLIAAAPDLYEALREITNAFTLNYAVAHPVGQGAIAKARAVLAKVQS